MVWAPSAKSLEGAGTYWQFQLISEDSCMGMINPCALAAKRAEDEKLKKQMRETQEHEEWRWHEEWKQGLTEKPVRK